MPEKEKRTEAEIHDVIVRDAQHRVGCDHFAPEFTLYEYPGPAANWGVLVVDDVGVWPPECAEAFKQAVVRARRTFDIEWPRRGATPCQN